MQFNFTLFGCSSTFILLDDLLLAIVGLRLIALSSLYTALVAFHLIICAKVTVGKVVIRVDHIVIAEVATCLALEAFVTAGLTINLIL